MDHIPQTQGITEITKNYDRQRKTKPGNAKVVPGGIAMGAASGPNEHLALVGKTSSPLVCPLSLLQKCQGEKIQIQPINQKPKRMTIIKPKRKWPLAEAKAQAVNILGCIRDHCERIEIVGSVRRDKQEVGDIELLFVPKMVSERVDLLTDRGVPATDALFDRLLDLRAISKRPNVNGQFTWGPLNKLAQLEPSGLACDFFATTRANFFVSLVIRTGPKDFNVRMIQTAAKHGVKVHAYGGLEDENGPIPISSEAEVLSICGIPWTEPRDRK